MTRLRKVIAKRMVESLQVAAQLTTVVEVDVTVDGPQRSLHGVAPGQSLVLYDGTRVLGQATVASTTPAVPTGAAPTPGVPTAAVPSPAASTPDVAPTPAHRA